MAPTHGCVPIEGYTGPSVAETRTFKFRSRPEAVSAARRALDGFDLHLDAGVFYDASLCVSELVTNAVLHSDIGPDDELELEVAIDAGVLRVSVTYSGDEAVSPVEPTLEDESGWGLFIVDRLAHRWGVEREVGTRVWFEIGVVAGGESERSPATTSRDGDEPDEALERNVRRRSAGKVRLRPQPTT
jgi:anti-sigma regulatory factor (Ser/Thr protein kinase)